MSDVASLAAAAAKLGAAELRELRAEIDLMEKRRRREFYDLNGFSVGLTRLDDEDYRKMRCRSIAIQEDGFFQLRLLFPLREQSKRLNLAEIHFILRHLYGKRSIYYDDYKGSFSFPFALDVIKANASFPYMFRVHDWRGTPEFSVRKILNCKKEADSSLHAPFEEEFSREEINHWIAYFYGYFQGCFEVFQKSGEQPDPFLHRVPSNFILYGYRDDAFFEHQYDRQEEFKQAYREYAIAMQIEDEEEP